MLRGTREQGHRPPAAAAVPRVRRAGEGGGVDQMGGKPVIVMPSSMTKGLGDDKDIRRLFVRRFVVRLDQMAARGNVERVGSGRTGCGGDCGAIY